MDLKSGLITAKTTGAIGWLTFDNPSKLNALSPGMSEDALTVIEAYEADPAIKVVIMRGAGQKAFISGGVVIHQYSRIGRLAMIGGNTRVNSDLPPYFLYTDFNVAAHGLNLVGLKRAGFTADDISALKAAYRLLYRSGLKLEEALQRIEAEIPTEHARHLASFIRASKRGICRE